ncbi:MAG: hypothetical protein K0Q87_4024 [Neobacillus sp.]|jgi:glucan-binding YG repeat protein/uncharacterized protein YgiM (DUF1202 family)|nr:hypothetical protein [Neobacillus sp.]
MVKKVIFRSLGMAILSLGLFSSAAFAVENEQLTGTTSEVNSTNGSVVLTIQADTKQTEMHVTSVKLPVYRSFEELSDYRIHLGEGYERYAELNYSDKVTILSVEDYGAEIRMADGRVGWVHKDYLSSDVMNQTWLVKEWRNVRKGPDTSTEIIGEIPDHSKVYVLDYNGLTNFYLIQTEEGLQGWIYGLYIDYKEGNNLIKYEFEKEGTVTNQITVFTPLNTVANITANELNLFINYKTKGQKTLMTCMGSAFIEAQNVSGLNAIYLVAHAGLETGWGVSGIVNNKYNFYGIGAIDSMPMEAAKKFMTPKDGIVAGANWINQMYVSRDQYMENYAYPQPTLDNMRNDNSWHQYSTDEAWAVKVANIAKEFYDFSFKNGEVLKVGWVPEGSEKYYFDISGRMLTGAQMIDGKKYHFKLNGYLSMNWQLIDGKWYMINPDGTYKTGWLLDSGKWYYLNHLGVMQTGWELINGKWYYLNHPNGSMRTGWQLISGKWYFLNKAGDMKTGWFYSGGKWYFLNSNGDMQTGWLYNGGRWYFLKGNGEMQTGWLLNGGKWYYLYSDGSMAKNTTISGYKLNSSGAWIR